MPRLQVLEWNAWQRFLVNHIARDAERVRASPGEPLATLTDPEAAVLLHVNLSRPSAAFPDYGQWLGQREAAGVPVLNGYCASIDKWAVQDACAAAGLPQVRATRDGDPDEPLILKARANYSGMFEDLLPAELVGDMAAPSWPYPQRVHRLARREVPQEVWSDPRMTVERYVGNAEGRFQRAYVAGDYVAVATSASPAVLKEMNQREVIALSSAASMAARVDDEGDPLSVAFRLARAMRADFCAIDLALDDEGRPHPIDLNMTPSWGAETLNPQLIGELQEAFVPLREAGSRYAAVVDHATRIGAAAG